MIRTIEITNEMRALAESVADFYESESLKPGALTPKFFTRDAFLVGFLGELVVKSYFGLPLEMPTGYIDTTHDVEVKGLKVDVKTSHLREPIENLRSGYKCFVATTQRLQRIDIVVFVRLSPDLRKGYIFGYIPRDELDRFAKVKFYNLQVPAYSIPLGELKDIENLRGGV